MRNLVACSILAAGLAWAQHSVAAPTDGTDMKAVDLGGVGATCGLKKSEVDDEKSIATVAKDNDLKLVDMTKDDAKKLVDALNAAKPVTTMKADKVIIYKGEKHAFMFVVNAGRFCALPPLPIAVFNKLADEAFGAGS